MVLVHEISWSILCIKSRTASQKIWTFQSYCCQVGILASLYAFLLGLDLMGVAFKALGGKGLGLRRERWQVAGVSQIPGGFRFPTKMIHLKGAFGVPKFWQRTILDAQLPAFFHRKSKSCCAKHGPGAGQLFSLTANPIAGMASVGAELWEGFKQRQAISGARFDGRSSCHCARTVIVHQHIHCRNSSTKCIFSFL